MGMNRRDFVKLSALAVGAGAIPQAYASSGAVLEGPVNWLSWGVYDVPAVVNGFEQAKGAKINVINFEDNSSGFLKVKQNIAAYDVGMADGFWPQLYYQANLIEPLDLSTFSSAQTLVPAFKHYKPWEAAGGILQYPNCWSAEPIIYRKSAVKEFKSAWDAWDPQFKKKIVMYDSATSIIPAIATWLGYDATTMTDEQLGEVKKRLIDLKPNIISFAKSSGELAQALAAGAGDVAFSSSQALVLRIKEAGGGDWGNIFPEEGVCGWVDGNMLIKGAQHEAAAREWINYHGSPENQAIQSTVCRYPTTNERAIQLLKDQGQGELVEAAQMDRFDLLENMVLLAPPENLESWLSVWNEFKAS